MQNLNFWLCKDIHVILSGSLNIWIVAKAYLTKGRFGLVWFNGIQILQKSRFPKTIFMDPYLEIWGQIE